MKRLVTVISITFLGLVTQAEVLPRNMSPVHVRLNDGRYFFLGGTPSSEIVKQMTGTDANFNFSDVDYSRHGFVFDPSKLSWAKTSQSEYVYARAGSWLPGLQLPSITLLSNGKVFVVSQFGSEIYDPTKKLWYAVAPMKKPRIFSSITLMRDGKVLVAGGTTDFNTFGNPTPTSDVEIYNPKTNKWASAAPLASPRQRHSALLLNDGRILVLNGSSVPEIYDPSTNKWSSKAPLSGNIESAQALPNGNLIGARRLNNQSCLAVFDVQNDKWVDSNECTGLKYEILPNLSVVKFSQSAASAFRRDISLWQASVTGQNVALSWLGVQAELAVEHLYYQDWEVFGPDSSGSVFFFSGLGTSILDIQMGEFKNLDVSGERKYTDSVIEDVFQDDSGLKWSQPIAKTLSQFTGESLALMSSYCEEAGGRVPNFSEFEALINSFDHVSDQVAGPNGLISTTKLTPLGLSQLNSVLPIPAAKWWWKPAKTFVGGVKNAAGEHQLFYFDNNKGVFIWEKVPLNDTLVRCVR